MRILAAIQRVPGGLMVVPLLLGALLNTIDQLHLGWIQSILKQLGAPLVTTVSGEKAYEFLRIGGFSQALFKDSAGVLIALFLFCVGTQMNLRVGGRALRKGLAIGGSKFALGVGLGYLLAMVSDPFYGLLGLSYVAIIAGLTNENGGMYAALTKQFGNKSDTGSLAVLSINDGPFLTLVALALIGETFPFISFLAVLLPIAIGMLLGNLDERIREFCSHGETLLIPFFAFALGAGSMNFADFAKPPVLIAGLVLGLATVIIISGIGILALRLTGERSTIAAVCGGSVAGNAIATPKMVAAAAAVAAAANPASMPPERLKAFQDLVPIASAQLTIAVLTTAILCPLAVVAWDRYQRRRGIDARIEPGEEEAIPEPASGAA